MAGKSASSELTIREQCRSCTGHGVLGDGTKPGVGRICYVCRGRGWTMYTYKPFTVRNVRNDLKIIEIPAIKPLGKGKVKSIRKTIPYKKFLEIAKKHDRKQGLKRAR